MIDWTKPIELDTVPPRLAKVVAVARDGIADVLADWNGDGGAYLQFVNPNGEKHFRLEGAECPRVRNVAAPDIAAELAEASSALLARWLGGEGDMEDDDRIERNMRAALAKYEASK